MLDLMCFLNVLHCQLKISIQQIRGGAKLRTICDSLQTSHGKLVDRKIKEGFEAKHLLRTIEN